MRDATPTVVRFLHPAPMPPSVGYPQLVEVAGSKMVYIAGQAAFDPAGILNPGVIFDETAPPGDTP